jgi:hypothetical protein
MREMDAKYRVSVCHIASFISETKYTYAPVSTGNMFQDLPRLRKTADNTESYIYIYICIYEMRFV